MSLKDELSTNFEFVGATPSEDVLHLCMEMCEKYSISAEDFVDQWSSFTITHNYDPTPTRELLNMMERKDLKISGFRDKISTPNESKLRGSFRTESEKNNESIVEAYIPTSAKSKKVLNLNGGSTPKPLLENSTILASETQTACTQYEKRTNAMSVAVHYNKNENLPDSSGDFKATVANLTPVSKDNMRYMYERPIYQLTAMYKFTKTLTNVMQSKLKQISEEETDKVCSGRLIGEKEDKLNPSTISLQLLDGNTTKLEFADSISCSLFPGQTVSIRGTSLKRNFFAVKEISDDATQQIEGSVDIKDNLSIVFAAGPFTLQNNLLYEPLQDFLKYVVEKRPNVLILAGPFLDENHDTIVKGDSMENYQQHFENLMDMVMYAVQTVPNLEVVVISSSKDVHHDVAYPTMPYQMPPKYPNLSFMPDPSLLSINGAIIGLSTVDIMFHLAKHDLAMNVYGDRMSSMASHVLKQRCFYPLYPVDEDVCVDLELLYQYGTMDVVPHILILPSNFTFFAKKIDNTLVVNPQRLTKSSSGGTFAHIRVPGGLHANVAEKTDCQIVYV